MPSRTLNTTLFAFLLATLTESHRVAAESSVEPSVSYALQNEAEQGPLPPASLAITVGVRHETTGDDLRASAWLSVPWDAWLRQTKGKEADGARLDGLNAKHDANEKTARHEPDEPRALPQEAREDPHKKGLTKTPPPSHERAIVAWLAVRGLDAQAAVAAGLAQTDFVERAAHLADLSRRARQSSALPQLRLRAMRVTNESAQMLPTSYDPLRQTLSGGTSVWLEARATWNLDRALFATEELRVASLERSLREERNAVERRVLDALYAWQAAAAERLDPSASFRECRFAYVKELRSEAELERLTGTWFAAFRAGKPALPEADCLAVAERVER